MHPYAKIEQVQLTPTQKLLKYCEVSLTTSIMESPKFQALMAGIEQSNSCNITGFTLSGGCLTFYTQQKDVFVMDDDFDKIVTHSTIYTRK